MELALTIPARLSSLLPHLPLLMRLMVHALKSYGDLVNLGLRTLEFWVDNLNPEFLYPVMCSQPAVFTDLMKSLCKHLRPAPYPYGMLSLRLLGKLGGRNRRFLGDSIGLRVPNLHGLAPAGLSLECAWAASRDISPGSEPPAASEGGATHELPLDSAIAEAGKTIKLVATAPPLKPRPAPPFPVENTTEVPTTCAKAAESRLELCDMTKYCVGVMERVKEDQVKASLQVVKSALAMVIDVSYDPRSVSLHPPRRPGDCDAMENDGVPSPSVEFKSPGPSNHAKDAAFRLLLKSALLATAVDSTRSEAWDIVDGLFAHALLYLRVRAGDVVKVDAFGRQDETSCLYCLKSSAAVEFDVFAVSDAAADAMSEMEPTFGVSVVERLTAVKDKLEGGADLDLGDTLFPSLISVLVRRATDAPWNHKVRFTTPLLSLLRQVKRPEDPLVASLIGLISFMTGDTPLEVSSSAVEDNVKVSAENEPRRQRLPS